MSSIQTNIQIEDNKNNNDIEINTEQLKDYLSLNDSVDYLEVNRASVYKHIKKNNMVKYKYNARTYFAKTDIDKIKVDVDFNKMGRSETIGGSNSSNIEDVLESSATHVDDVQDTESLNSRRIVDVLIKENEQLKNELTQLRQDLTELYTKYIQSVEQSKIEINELALRIAEMNKNNQVLLMEKVEDKNKDKKKNWLKSLFASNSSNSN